MIHFGGLRDHIFGKFNDRIPCFVVSTDFDCAGEARALVFVLCIVNIVHACFGICPELSDAPCDDVFDKIVGSNGPCEIRNDDAYARRHNLQV